MTGQRRMGYGRTGHASKTVFFEGAQIGLRLDRGLGRFLYTDSQTNDRWDFFGAEFCMIFSRIRGSTPPAYVDIGIPTDPSKGSSSNDVPQALVKFAHPLGAWDSSRVGIRWKSFLASSQPMGRLLCCNRGPPRTPMNIHGILVPWTSRIYAGGGALRTAAGGVAVLNHVRNEAQCLEPRMSL